MVSELPCAVTSCPALATHGDYCAAHVDMRKEAYPTRCQLCTRTIRSGAWHKQTAGGCQCSPACKPKKTQPTPANRNGALA